MHKGTLVAPYITIIGPNVIAFTSPADLMKNLPKMTMANISKAMLTVSPSIKFSMREYEDMAIRVGNKITIEIKKSDSSSVR